MKPSIYRRMRRRPAGRDIAAPKKDNQQEQQFFGETTHEPFFKPVAANHQSTSVQRKCADCEKEDKLQRSPEKKEEEKKLHRMPDKKEEEKKVHRTADKKEEEKVQRLPEKKEEEKIHKKEDKKEEEKIHKKEDKKEEEKIHKKEGAVSTANTSVTASNYISSISGKGQSMDAGVQSFYESRMGADFSDVKIHTGKEAAASARDINAQAYAFGNHIVFDEGKYQPESGEGKHLLAHELTHILQQNHANSVKRKQPAAGAGAAPTAGSAPSLKPYKINAAACALLIVIHNDEENAKMTAKAIADNCSYNLLLLEPGSERGMKIPGNNGTFDPNGLFPPDVADLCYNSPADCEKYLADKAGSADAGEIMRFVQIQFFMAIRKYSNNFSLPVVALHNNSIDDTAKYKSKKDPAKTAAVKKDIDKDNMEAGKDPAKELRKLLDDEFGTDTKKELMTKGKTNIFLWCASNDINKCHIGDPDNPDRVIWVTNEEDFKKLKTKDVNVGLQSKVPTDPNSNSIKDLSTLFPTLKGLAEAKYVALWEYFKDKVMRMTWINEVEKYKILKDIDDRIFDVYSKELSLLRYVNIETPGLKQGEQKDSDRIANFQFIADTLKTLGIYCCDSAALKSETAIEKALTVQKAR